MSRLSDLLFQIFYLIDNSIGILLSYRIQYIQVYYNPINYSIQTQNNNNSHSMQILDFTDSLLLTKTASKLYLLKSPSLTVVSELEGKYEHGSLQYSTGIAALTRGSFVSLYDFKYRRMVAEFDAVLGLVGVRIIKNLVFCISEFRVIIHDIATNTNLCHIPTSCGSHVTLSSNYYTLKLLYPVSPNIYHQQQIWTNKTKRIECSPCSIIKYDKNGQLLCLVQDNVVALYENQEVVRGCSFEGTVGKVVVGRGNGAKGLGEGPGKFYVGILGYGSQELSKIEKQVVTGNQNKELEKSQQKQVKQNQNNDGKVVKYVQVSLTHKNYLKLVQVQTIQHQHLGKQQQLVFQHKNSLYIYSNHKLHKAQIDIEPSFPLSKQLSSSSNPNSDNNPSNDSIDINKCIQDADNHTPKNKNTGIYRIANKNDWLLNTGHDSIVVSTMEIDLEKEEIAKLPNMDKIIAIQEEEESEIGYANRESIMIENSVIQEANLMNEGEPHGTIQENGYNDIQKKREENQNKDQLK